SDPHRWVRNRQYGRQLAASTICRRSAWRRVARRSSRGWTARALLVRPNIDRLTFRSACCPRSNSSFLSEWAVVLGNSLSVLDGSRKRLQNHDSYLPVTFSASLVPITFAYAKPSALM